MKVFSDRDIATRRTEIEAALKEADVFFGSLLFDYDQVADSQFCLPTCLSKSLIPITISLLIPARVGKLSPLSLERYPAQ